MKTKLLFLFATALMSIQAQTVYVKRYATGLNNGTSWTNAYTDLKTALTNATWIYRMGFRRYLYLPAASPRSASFAITINL
ncbi:MAG: hypothetical protein IPK03_13000 [Bacteroidetes bacterium]|nr:hypothetical protein [Bacteroidota bacterium]